MKKKFYFIYFKKYFFIVFYSFIFFPLFSSKNTEKKFSIKSYFKKYSKLSSIIMSSFACGLLEALVRKTSNEVVVSNFSAKEILYMGSSSILGGIIGTQLTKKEDNLFKKIAWVGGGLAAGWLSSLLVKSCITDNSLKKDIAFRLMPTVGAGSAWYLYASNCRTEEVEKEEKVVKVVKEKLLEEEKKVGEVKKEEERLEEERRKEEEERLEKEVEKEVEKLFKMNVIELEKIAAGGDNLKLLEKFTENISFDDYDS